MHLCHILIIYKLYYSYLFKINIYICGAQVIYGSGPFTRGESKGPSRGGLWPKLDNTRHKIALGYSRGQFSFRQNPKSHRTEPKVPPDRGTETV